MTALADSGVVADMASLPDFGPLADAALASDAAPDAEWTDGAVADAELPLPDGEVVPFEAPEAQPLRRLSRVEYGNTVRTLFGFGPEVQPELNLSEDTPSGGFDNQAETQVVASLLAEGYLQAAEAVAERVLEDIEAHAPCEDGAVPSQCAVSFVNSFLPRAFRRPITDAERTRYLESWQLGAVDGYAQGITYVIQHALMAPQFIYRLEFGDTPIQIQGVEVTPASGYEIASRLSYFLWQDMPDAALLEAAAAGELDDVEGIRAQALRMLEDPKARQSAKAFFRQWTGIIQMPSVEKEAALFPEFDAARDTLRDEAERYFEHMVFEGQDTFEALLTAPQAFAGPETASFYDVEPPEAPMSPVALDPSHRAGLLTLPALLAVHSQSTRTSPVLRGHFVRTQLLCGYVPGPPPGTDTSVPLIDPEDPSFDDDPFAQTMSDEECVGCHRLMNPIGWALEGFDAVGRHTPDRRGMPISVQGEFFRSDINGVFNGPVELAETLARSTQVQQCYTKQWYRYAHGHTERGSDRASLEALYQAFSDSDGQTQSLILDLTTSDSFRLR